MKGEDPFSAHPADWGLHPGFRVLDAGCGTGRLGPAWAGSGCRWVGLDADADALGTGATENPLPPGQGWRVAADLASLPWRDGANPPFDALIACDVLSFAESPAVWRHWTEGLWASLRPGGVFWVRMRAPAPESKPPAAGAGLPEAEFQTSGGWTRITLAGLRRWARDHGAEWARPPAPSPARRDHLEWVWRKPSRA